MAMGDGDASPFNLIKTLDAVKASSLNGYEKGILYTLLLTVSNEGRIPYESQATIAEGSGFSVSTVKRYLGTLKTLGVLRSSAFKNNTSYRYDLSFVRGVCELLARPKKTREVDPEFKLQLDSVRSVGTEGQVCETPLVRSVRATNEPKHNDPKRNEPKIVYPAGAGDTHDPSLKVQKEKQKPSKQKKVPLPSTFSPNEEDLAVAASLVGLNETDQRKDFLDHYRSQPKLSADWHAEYRKWLRKAHGYAIKNGLIEKPKGPIIADSPGQVAFDERERVRKAEIAAQRRRDVAALVAKYELKETGDRETDERAFKAALDMEARMIGQVDRNSSSAMAN